MRAVQSGGVSVQQQPLCPGAGACRQDRPVAGLRTFHAVSDEHCGDGGDVTSQHGAAKLGVQKRAEDEKRSARHPRAPARHARETVICVTSQLPLWKVAAQEVR